MANRFLYFCGTYRKLQSSATIKAVFFPNFSKYVWSHYITRKLPPKSRSYKSLSCGADIFSTMRYSHIWRSHPWLRGHQAPSIRVLNLPWSTFPIIVVCICFTPVVNGRKSLNKKIRVSPTKGHLTVPVITLGGWLDVSRTPPSKIWDLLRYLEYRT